MMQHKDKTSPLSLRENTLWNACGCFFYLGCQWLTTILVVRLSADYNNSGILAFAMANGTIFASIGLYKTRAFQVSDIAGEYTDGEYIGFRFLTIALGIICMAFYIPLVTDNPSYLIASTAYLLFKSDEVFSDVLYGIYQRRERMDYIGKSQLLRGLASLTGFSAPLAFGANLAMAIFVMALTCLAVTLLYDLPHIRLFCAGKPDFSKHALISLAKSCFLAMLSALCANSIVSIVRQFYGVCYGSELLGVYASIATPAVLIQVAATYLYSPLIGALAKTRHGNGAAAFKRHFTHVLLLLIFAIASLIVLLTFIGEPALKMVFGPTIAPYTYLFPYVLVATGSMGVLFYMSDVLVVLRRMKAMLACNALALALALALAIPLTANLGMNGINIAIIGASLFSIVFSILIVLRHAQPHHH